MIPDAMIAGTCSICLKVDLMGKGSMSLPKNR
jgi:hypothetical protein